MKKLIDKYWGILAIFVLWLILFILNFVFGTWLSGWDNLHPEFNFALNIKRSFFAGWQEYQGLGLLGGMGHASELFRQIILWFFSLVLPTSFLRYFFHFSMLLIGSLGIYFLVNDFVLEKKDETVKKISSLGAGIFYLFNLATLQMFFVPYESFSTHFGFLPWLFWGVFRYLKEPSKKNIFIFILINVLSVSQGYVATVFLVYLIALCLVLLQCVIPDLVRNLHNRHSGEERSNDSRIDPGCASLTRMTGRVVIILLITFCVNAFWLLPNLHFLMTEVGTNTGAKINLMSTENNLLLNKKYGDLKNVALLKGFWFDNVELKNPGVMGYIMGDWVKHAQNPFIQGIGYLLFGLSILGIIFAIKTKNKKALVFLPVFLLAFTFLANDTFGFSFIDKLLYKLPLVSQIFRFPFTKFSILTAFCEAIFYGIIVVEILSRHSEERSDSRIRFWMHSLRSFTRMTRVFLVLFFIVLPIIFLFPVFQGKLFYVKEKARIPNEYFQVFDFFKTQDKNTRIANFPQPTYWGWTNYQWNSQLYSGSGFLWYGIQQPILDRAFDVWSAKNENYYWEISYALYSKNKDSFERVLEKYQINWLLVDGNVINLGSSKALFLDELEEMIGGQKTEDRRQMAEDGRQNDRFELVQTFGKIKIYKVNLQAPVKDFVWVGENLPTVNGYEWGNEDKAYSEIGNYISDSNSKFKIQNSKLQLKIQNFGNDYDIYYPFRILFTGRTSEDLDFEIEDKGDHFIFKKKLPKEVLSGYSLEGVNLLDLRGVNVVPFGGSYFVPTAEVVGDSIEVNIPKVSELSTTIDPFYAPAVLKAENCNQFSKGEVKVTRLRQGCLLRRSGYEGRVGGQGSLNNGAVRLEATDATNCSAAFYLSELLHKYGYLISIESKNISGKSLLFWVENLTNRKADMEIYLPSLTGSHPSWLIQPPMASDGLGYTLHFDNVSIGREKTVNELGKITVNPIPYEYLMKIKLVSSIQYQVLRGGLNVLDLEGLTGLDLKVNHPNSSVYEVEINGAVGENETLVLSQAYHEGWKAYKITNCELRIANLFPFLCGKELWHVKVNNWENGWQLVANNSQQTTVNYQQLEVGSRKLEVEKQVIILFFWPQYLEYAGFVIFIGALVSILLYNNHHK